MALMLVNAGATVISCNSQTKNLIEKTKSADIVIVAAGHP
jgi:5,10-methylene-tetrahydrofolate dehydrogenase/methenyl tetrahydrofolate cyclohydrolase